MVTAKDIAVIGAGLLGGYLLYDYLKTKGFIRVAGTPQPERSQTISTSGQLLNYRPRTSYYLGNSGSTREIENHVRGEAVTPKTWRGTYGSILQPQVTGTFANGELGIPFPEEVHVTPQLEAVLAESVQRQSWGGEPPVEGTFG